MNSFFSAGLRRLFFFLLCGTVFCSAGCGRGNTSDSTFTETGNSFRVVATLFPYYDFARQIGGGNIELSMVVPAGMDSHSFEPTPADIRMIQEADLLICNGGHMEQWVSRVLDSLGEDAPETISMMDYVDVVEEEIVEGMEVSGDEHEHEHGEEADLHEEAEEDESRYEIEYDEHIWTSPVNAMKITEIISRTLQEMDPEHRESYETNATAYTEQLEELDREFRQVVSQGKRDIMIFGDKFPLRYFTDEYGLRYRAAFSGCSSDTEPSARTIAYLIDKVREEQIPVIYYLELSSPRVAEIIGEETGAEPMLFHSCHNVTRREFDGGVTYLQLMENNINALREGLCR